VSTIAGVIARRGITEVLHFSTNHGLTGILAEGAVLSRERLPESKYLEHVYKPNASVRKDRAWLDYVNLSISRINTEFFGHSTRWHANQDLWWCVLSLDPTIMSDSGVVFAATNNIYTGCRHAAGAPGLEALFAPKVERWEGNVVRRTPDMPEAWTTCHQAEVLYPERLSCQHLRCVYVATGPHADIAASTCDILMNMSTENDQRGRVPVEVRPDVFEP
jgi:hypothetical protein